MTYSYGEMKDYYEREKDARDRHIFNHVRVAAKAIGSEIDESDHNEDGEPYAECSVSDCFANTNQRYDKYGAIIQHLETEEIFCVSHAMEGIRNKTIPNWQFREYGVDEDNEPDDYDCLAGNPKCEKCECRLSMDDLDKWLEKPELPPYCEGCYVSPVKVKIKIKRKH